MCRQGIVSKTFRYVNEQTSEVANAVLMLLCNLTREKNNAIVVYEAFTDQITVLETLIKLFTRNDEKERNYDYVAYLLSNLCQLHEVRMQVFYIKIFHSKL